MASKASAKDIFASLEQSKQDMANLRKAFTKTAATTRKLNAVTTTSSNYGYTTTNTFGPSSSGLVGTGTTAYFTPAGWMPSCAFCLVREDDNAVIPQAATQIDGTALCRECARQVLNIIEEED